MGWGIIPIKLLALSKHDIHEKLLRGVRVRHYKLVIQSSCFTKQEEIEWTLLSDVIIPDKGNELYTYRKRIPVNLVSDRFRCWLPTAVIKLGH